MKKNIEVNCFDLLKFEDLKDGIQEVSLDINELFLNRRERDRRDFEERLSYFLKFVDENDYSNIVRREGDFLIYRTECIIPEERNSETPVLILLGNPALHSVRSEMFFSFEGKGREHRFWKTLRQANFLLFRSDTDKQDVSLAERNKLRKEELFDLSYKSPFRIGLAVFYSMPSGASGKWAGVAGLRRLFWKKALTRIAECERERVESQIRKFASPKGLVVAFQKDAYLHVKSSDSIGYSLTEAKRGKLKGECRCDKGVELYGFPPTRLMSINSTLLRNLTTRAV